MARRPDLTLEDNAKKKIWICDMACHQQQNIEAKKLEKLNKYKQLAHKSRVRHPEYKIMIAPMVIGALCADIGQIMVDMGTFFENKDLLK